MVVSWPVMTDEPKIQLHHRQLELARAQIIELLTRQAVERELVSKSEGGSSQADVVS